MSDRPAGHLKCVGYQFRTHDGIPIEHYVFDDGSTWICRNANSWSLDWNPELNSAEAVVDLENIKPYATVPEKTFSELHRKYEDLKLEEALLRVKIKDWQKVNEITAKQRDDAKARIAELETELKVQKAKFDVAETKALEYLERMKKAESELAALKAKSQEVPPLDKWRVLMTAHRICGDQSCGATLLVSKAFWGLLGSYLWNAFEIEEKAGAKPYPVK